MYSLGCKLIVLDSVRHIGLFTDKHFLWLEVLTTLANNPDKYLLNKPKHYFILFLIITYW